MQKIDLESATQQIKQIANFEEAAVLATCNRVEFYAVTHDKMNLKEAVRQFYHARGVIVDWKDDKWQVRHGSSVGRHLFRVSSGLDAALIGEYQILGQVKDAYSAACSVSGPGKILHKLFHNAFHAAKRVRTETAIGGGAQGLAGAAIELLENTREVDFSKINVVIIGVNKLTDILLKKLTQSASRITLLNRTLYNAEKLALVYDIEVRSIESLTDAVTNADVLFCVASADEYLVSNRHISENNPAKSLLAVDLAIPRNIDPSLRKLSSVELYDLDDIKLYLSEAEHERMDDLPRAMEIVEEQVLEFETWRSHLQNHNHAALRALLEEDRRDMLDKFRASFKNGEHKALESFSRNLYKQFLRRIISEETQKEISEI